MVSGETRDRKINRYKSAFSFACLCPLPERLSARLADLYLGARFPPRYIKREEVSPEIRPCSSTCKQDLRVSKLVQQLFARG